MVQPLRGGSTFPAAIECRASFGLVTSRHISGTPPMGLANALRSPSVSACRRLVVRLLHRPLEVLHLVAELAVLLPEGGAFYGRLNEGSRRPKLHGTCVLLFQARQMRGGRGGLSILPPSCHWRPPETLISDPAPSILQGAADKRSPPAPVTTPSP